MEWLFFFLLIFVVSCKSIAQKKSDTPIEKSIKSFNALTTESAKYELEFVEEKNTLLLKYNLGKQKRLDYKAILQHVHPEGIFIIEKENTKFLRMLSINNQKVFIKGKYRGDFRTSNNTNIIEIVV